MSMMPQNTPPTAPKPSASMLRTVQAVVWSFVGLRSRQEFEKDTQQLNPIHVVIAGFAGVVVFIGVLALMVHWAVKAA
jgi:Protein of unknown function (DUF2970)